jgi:hypothetical protein
MKKIGCLVLLIILFLCFKAEAATINAASCSQNHVQSAVDSANDGDTVVVPAGSASWTNSVLDEPVIVINKGITLIGAGIGKTVITDATLDNNNNVQETLIQVSGSEGKPFRISGFSFLEMNDTGIKIYGSCKNWRVDHINIENAPGDLGEYAIYIGGHTYGVIDHCTFKGRIEICFKGRNDPDWELPLTLGSANAVYIEDCTFRGADGTGALCDMCDGDDGARLVVRYNTVTNQYPHVHGALGTGRSAFSIEVYENTFIDNGGTNCYCMGSIRGGTGVVFNNDYQGDWGGFHVRDQSYEDGACTGYSCLDQVGRTTGQALEPLCEWNNTRNGVEDMDFHAHCAQCAEVIHAGRDYLNDTQKSGYTPYTYPHPLVTGEEPPPPDTTPPSDIASVNDGEGADVDSTVSTIQLKANWTPSTDDESGISKYWYAVGTSPGLAGIVGWTSTAAGTVTGVTCSGLSLTIGTTYYFTVKAENGVNMQSAATSSDGQWVEDVNDTTPPYNIATVNDGTGQDIDTTSSTTELSANWTESSDPETGISRYDYAIGTTQGGTDILGWTSTSNGTVTGVTENGLSLSVGVMYYFTVKAVNGVGLESMPASSDGQCVVDGGTGNDTPEIPGNEIDAKVYPSPYSPSRGSSMRFSIDNTTGGEVKIYTISGRLVKKLLIQSGESEVDWNVLNEDGNSITTGLYIYSITDAEGNRKTGKVAIAQ